MLRRIALLGSTGSIGINTLDVASALKGKIKVTALSADSNIKLLAEQARIFKPKVICIRNGQLAKELKRMVHFDTAVLCGNGGLEEIVSRKDVDTAVFAMSGSSCIKPLAAAIKNKKRIALANKEALVSAGSYLTRIAKKNGVQIIPIDSEHSAVFQCLEGRREYLKKIYLTATGGPLFNIPKNRFDRMPARFILNHPKWKMGRKISVDSATMMNKGLEIIEAKWLFDMDADDIEVVVHREAVVHSIIELIDGTFFAEMSVPDMRIPIQYALTYPDRFNAKVKTLNFAATKKLSFEKPDFAKFPCLGLARLAMERGGAYPAVLNIADEEAVKKYLEGKIKFSRIPCIIEKVLDKYSGPKGKEPSLNDIFGAETWAREESSKLCR